MFLLYIKRNIFPIQCLYGYVIVALNRVYCGSFKILIKSSTFTIDYEYYLRHVCVHTIIGKNVKYIMSNANKERKKSFSLVILYWFWIKRIARGILWVARCASFVYSIDDYSTKLKTSRPATLFLCHTAQTFERFRRAKCRSVKQIKAKAAFL